MALPVQAWCWPMRLERWMLPVPLEWLAWRLLVWQLQV